MNLIHNKRIKQIGALYLSLACNIIIGIGVSVVNTRLLGPQQYGDLKFLQTIFKFINIFLTLGLFITGGRQLALKKNTPIYKQICQNLLLFASIISIILSSF